MNVTYYICDTVSTNRVTKQRQSLEMSDENCLSNPRIKGNWLKNKPTPYLSPKKFLLGSAESKITYIELSLCVQAN